MNVNTKAEYLKTWTSIVVLADLFHWYNFNLRSFSTNVISIYFSQLAYDFKILWHWLIHLSKLSAILINLKTSATFLMLLLKNLLRKSTHIFYTYKLLRFSFAFWFQAACVSKLSWLCVSRRALLFFFCDFGQISI